MDIEKEKKENILDEKEHIEEKGKGEEKKLSEELMKNKELFENINSPSMIQDILHLSKESSQINLQMENNIVNSLSSINQILLPILENENEESNFNPLILIQNKKKDLYRLQFEPINITNNILKEKIKEYNNLNLKIKEYNNKKNKEIDDKLNSDKYNNQKDLENIKKEEINLKLFLVNHPLISLFKNKININEIKEELKSEYLNKMQDNTQYKYSPPTQIGLQMLLNNQLYNDLESENELNEDEDEEGTLDNGENVIGNSANDENENQNISEHFSDNSENSQMSIENEIHENNNNNNNLHAPNLEGNFEEVNENIEHIQNNENNNLNIQNNIQIVNNSMNNNNDNNNALPEP